MHARTPEGSAPLRSPRGFSEAGPPPSTLSKDGPPYLPACTVDREGDEIVVGASLVMRMHKLCDIAEALRSAVAAFHVPG